MFERQRQTNTKTNYEAAAQLKKRTGPAVVAAAFAAAAAAAVLLLLRELQLLGVWLHLLFLLQRRLLLP